jgi:cobalt-precorrin-5B (C1)-methyltransferase
MLVVGHVGKLVKVAAGVMNTHSRVADCRVEVLAAHAALAGASQRVVRQVMEAATTDAVVDILWEEGLLEQTMASITRRIGEHLTHRSADGLRVEAVMFSNQHGLLGATSGAEGLFARHMQGKAQDA